MTTPPPPPQPPVAVVIFCRPVDWSNRPPGFPALANPLPEPPKPIAAAIEECNRCGSEIYVEAQEANVRRATTEAGGLPVMICFPCTIFVRPSELGVRLGE